MEMRDDMLAAPPARIGVIDLNTCTLAESRGIEDAPFRFPVPLDRCAAFAGWFDTYFEGSPSCPAKNPVTLSTSPADGYTHWGQQVFFVPPAKVEAAVADAGGHPRGPSSTVGTISLRRQKEAVRLYNIAVKLEVAPDDPTTLDLDWELSSARAARLVSLYTVAPFPPTSSRLGGAAPWARARPGPGARRASERSSARRTGPDEAPVCPCSRAMRARRGGTTSNSSTGR